MASSWSDGLTGGLSQTVGSNSFVKPVNEVENVI